MTNTTSPTDLDFYANHTNEQLRSIHDRHMVTSVQITNTHGADHPLAVEAAAIANAAWMALALRGDSAASYSLDRPAWWHRVRHAGLTAAIRAGEYPRP